MHFCISFTESPINGERNINKTSPSSKAASEAEPLSPLASPLTSLPTSAAAAPSSGNSVQLDTSPYQSVFANSLSNGNRNIVAGLQQQQQQQYRDVSVLSSITPSTTSK